MFSIEQSSHTIPTVSAVVSIIYCIANVGVIYGWDLRGHMLFIILLLCKCIYFSFTNLRPL